MSRRDKFKAPLFPPSQSVSTALSSLSLRPHASTRCSALSGGNRRKVCAAASLLGAPDVVLMDEPTSGMDVLAKRQVLGCGVHLAPKKILGVFFSDFLAQKFGVASSFGQKFQAFFQACFKLWLKTFGFFFKL